MVEHDVIVVMMINEPTEGLMSILITEIWGILKKLNQDIVTVLLVEQNTRMPSA